MDEGQQNLLFGLIAGSAIALIAWRTGNHVRSWRQLAVNVAIGAPLVVLALAKQIALAITLSCLVFVVSLAWRRWHGPRPRRLT